MSPHEHRPLHAHCLPHLAHLEGIERISIELPLLRDEIMVSMNLSLAALLRAYANLFGFPFL